MSHPNSSRPNGSLPAEDPFTFEQLVACEEEQLRLAEFPTGGAGKALDYEVSSTGAADEPWLVFTNQDRVGLSLSGGGIRSATFNLGVLQALQEKGLLSLFDYVATVSGGGYVGGFWTAWRLRSQEKARLAGESSEQAPLLFPTPTEDDLASPRGGHSSGPRLQPLRDQRERPEIRHLREFSRFLMPRLGVLEVEMWNGIVAVLGGLLPSLLCVASLTVVVLLTWLGFVGIMVDLPFAWAAAAMAVATAVLHAAAESQWRAVNPAERAELNNYSVYVLGLLVSVASGAAIVFVRWLWSPFAVFDRVGLAPLDWAFGTDGYTLTVAYAPSLAWVAVAVMLLILRFFWFGIRQQSASGLFFERSLDRTIARCLGSGIAVAGLGGLWQAVFLLAEHWSRGVGVGTATGGTAIGLGTIFAFVRRWLESAAKPSANAGLLERLKPQLPKIVANLAVVAFVAFVAQFLIGLNLYSFERWASAGAAGGLLFLVILWFLDPTRIGLHDFYRGRIARCFLGAAHPASLKPKREPGLNRFTHERAEDDFTLGDLQRQTVMAEESGKAEAPLSLRPIHLVCCAANNLDGDHLATLYRGARSAVLSQRGLSLGNQTRQLPDLGFSSALTASASAFNSQMGAISMALGPAVSFLTVALNLRLGLWLPHPSGGKPLHPWFPGRLFLRELRGKTLASNPSHPEAPSPDFVHLSDGAHFENFGFYELIRRHCRYVLLCDCGADPENTYDDFAACLRRVREDFGVEVEIDFSPLRPGPDGLSAQHVAVGTIHYDGLGGSDKGTLLYIKPALTGDEPTDVAQYRRQNPDFPQQTTADQFFDEAQWESYRRLGEHAAHVIFRFADQRAANAEPSMRSGAAREDRQSSPEGIFFRASRLWRPGSRDRNEELVALTERANALESAIRDSAPAFLRTEFFPEANGQAAATPGPRDPAEESRGLFFLMQITQIMEDAWNLCHLGTEAQHPVNEGWMAYIGRWAVIPSFRRWWPLLASMYSDEFRRFIGSRFHLNVVLDPAAKNYAQDRITLRKVRAFDETGMAMKEWRRCGRRFSSADFPQATVPVDRFELWFTLEAQPGPGDATPAPLQIQVGFAEVERFHEGEAAIARLATRDLFVPDSLKGCGFTESLLDHLLHHYFSPRPQVGDTSSSVVEMRVRLDKTAGRRDPNARLLRIHLIAFFKSRFFAYRRQDGTESTSEIEELSRDVRRNSEAATHVPVV